MNDYVDIGDGLQANTEAAHGVGAATGWGPIQPITSGGSWGGGTDTARVVWEPGGNRSASLTLDFGGQTGASKFMALRWLDGMSGMDSFEFVVQDGFGHVSGGWLNNGVTNPEQWFDLVAWDVGPMWGVSTVTITATGAQWPGQPQWGQVAFSEAASYTIPAPVASVLVLVGVGIVGWIKRRRLI